MKSALSMTQIGNITNYNFTYKNVQTRDNFNSLYDLQKELKMKLKKSLLFQAKNAR